MVNRGVLKLRVPTNGLLYPMRAIVISLKDSPRRPFLAQNFGAVEVFDAVHGASEIEEYETEMLVRGQTRVPLDRALSQATRNKQLSKGQMGCTVSHYLLWKQLAESDDDSVLIMEDDAHVHRRQFELAMRSLPEPADVIYLQDVDSRFNTAPKIQEQYNSLFYRSRGPFPHTHGYIIYRDHAQRLVKDFRLAHAADGTLGSSIRDNPEARAYSMYVPCICLTPLAQKSDTWVAR